MAILEFALVTPLFLLLCMAAVDFGRVFRTCMTVTAANRAGLEYAGQSSASAGDTTGIANAVKAAAGNPAGMTVASSLFCTCTLGGAQTSCTNSCSGKTSYVQVTTTYSFSPVIAWPVVPQHSNVQSSGVMRVQ